MALNLYLDDCADSDLLYSLLRGASHSVTRPRDANTTGEDDPVHLAYAVAQGLILITKTPADFLSLHRLDSNHPGIFGVYQDNDITRDMTDGDIVAAIGRLEAASHLGLQIAGEFHKLNDWR